MSRTAARTVLTRGTAGAAGILLAVGIVGCSSDAGDTPAPSASPMTTGDSPIGETPSASPTSDSSSSGEALGADADLRKSQPAISAEDAMSKAKDAAGGGFMHSIELDYDETDAAWEWTVKFLDGTTDHKVELNADTGEVVENKSDSTNDEEKEVDLNDPMTYDDALAKATDKVDGPLHGWKLEYDDGRRAYQFDLMQGDQEVEVTVDVDSGQVLTD